MRFLAAALATRQRLHIAVDLLPAALSRRHREWLESGISLFCLGFVVVLGLGGIQAAKVSAVITSWSTTEVSRAWAYVAVPVGSFEAAQADLRGKGIELRDIRDASRGVKVGYFDDPEGNLVQVIYRPEPL